MKSETEFSSIRIR